MKKIHNFIEIIIKQKTDSNKRKDNINLINRKSKVKGKKKKKTKQKT